MNFGNWLVARRTWFGMKSRRTFSRKTGVSETLLYEIESNRGLPFHERNDSVREVIARAIFADPLQLIAFSMGHGEPPAIMVDVAPPVPAGRPVLPRDESTERRFLKSKGANEARQDGLALLQDFIALKPMEMRRAVAQLKKQDRKLLQNLLADDAPARKTGT